MIFRCCKTQQEQKTTYQVFAYDRRFKSARIRGGLTLERAKKLASETGGWIEEEL